MEKIEKKFNFDTDQLVQQDSFLEQLSGPASVRCPLNEHNNDDEKMTYSFRKLYIMIIVRV